MRRSLAANRSTAFLGVYKNGPFDIPGDLARAWLQLPANPNGRPNADVLKPRVNGMDLTRRPAGKWIVDFGEGMGEAEGGALRSSVRAYRGACEAGTSRKAAGEAPEVLGGDMVRRVRACGGRSTVCPASSQRQPFPSIGCLPGLTRASAQTISLSSLRVTTIRPSGSCTAGFTRRGRFGSVLWLGKGNDPRYTPTTTFETFPFPEGLSPDIPAADHADDPRAAAIAEAARRLVELRERWVAELVEWGRSGCRLPKALLAPRGNQR